MLDIHLVSVPLIRVGVRVEHLRFYTVAAQHSLVLQRSPILEESTACFYLDDASDDTSYQIEKGLFKTARNLEK